MNKTCFSMFRRGIHIKIICLCIALLLSACSSQTQAAPELLKPAAVPADIVAVERGDLREHRQIDGTVTLYTEPLYFTAEDATLLKINVKHGQEVAAGDILAELDTTDYLESLDALRDTLAHNEQVWAHENALAEIAAEMAELENTRTIAERKLKTYRVKEMRLNLELAKDLQGLERTRLQTRIAELESQRGGYFITAPFDGVIVYISDIQPGSVPGAREHLLFIGDTSRTMINCAWENSRYLTSANSLIADVDGQKYAVEEIPYTNEEYRSYFFMKTVPPVRLRLQDESVALRSDQQVYILASGGVKENALILPLNAVHNEALGVRYAYVDENGVRVRRNVKIGMIVDTYVEILEGLSEGEMVYVE